MEEGHLILIRKGGISIKIFSPEVQRNPLHAFLARVPTTHPSYPLLLSMKTNQSAGRHGEEKVLSSLREALHLQSATVLHDFHMRIPNAYAIQIDFIIFTKSYILLLEVKNIKGSIRFQQSPAQLVRILDGATQAMDCPFTQMTRNVMQFKKLLGNQPLPVYSAIVWANRSAVIEQLSFDVPHPLMFLKQLPDYISKLPTDEAEGISLQRLVKRVQSKATPFIHTNLCERYGVLPQELMRGYICLSCHEKLCLHVKTWICPSCKTQGKVYLMANIMGLFDLLGDKLTNEEIRLTIEEVSKRQMKELVNNGKLMVLGAKKNRRYQIIRDQKVRWTEIE